MLEVIDKLAKEFLEVSRDKMVRVISHFDTDGITSAAIIAKALKRLNIKFSVRIVKSLSKDVLEKELLRAKKEVLLFADLGSGSLDYFSKIDERIFILDHHELDGEKVSENVMIVNPHLFSGSEAELCSAGLCYLFAVALSKENQDLSSLAIVGMIGDRHDSNLSKRYQKIIRECEDLKIRKGLLIFSATRPLKRSLLYSTSCYIPGVTGSYKGVISLLQEIGISPDRTLEELNDTEMSRLVTAVMNRRAAGGSQDEIIGNIYLMKFFNRREDVRELSVLINACSRLGFSDIALSFCLESEFARQRAQEIYVKYKQELISGLKVAEDIKEENKNFVLINARGEIKDVIIGTICSMISSSSKYGKGTILIGMAYNEDKIKVSARIVGCGKNLKEVLEKSVCSLDAEVGGHKNAAGCLIKRENEFDFLEQLNKHLGVKVSEV